MDNPNPRTKQRGPTLHLTFRATTSCIPLARHQLRYWLDDLGVRKPIVDDLALASTELMTNAVEASPSRAAKITLQATFQAPDLLVEVSDEGSGFTMPKGGGPPGPEANRGRGLPIVQAVVDLVEVNRLPDKTRVTATLRLGKGDLVRSEA